MPKDLTSDDFEPSVIELTDEEGNEVPFDHLGTVNYQGADYLVLVPLDDEDDQDDDEDVGDDEDEGNIIILKIVPGAEQDEYVGVEDEDVLNAVFEQFMAMCEDEDEEEEE